MALFLRAPAAAADGGGAPPVPASLRCSGVDLLPLTAVHPRTNPWRDLARQGRGLKLWDAFRPLSVQQRMWNRIRDPRCVSDPSVHAGRHSRGTAEQRVHALRLRQAMERRGFVVYRTEWWHFDGKARTSFPPLP